MDTYRNIAMQWVAEPEHRPAVEAAARHLHANESLHLHDKINNTEPCSYCWLRAAKTVQAIERSGQRIVPREHVVALEQDVVRLTDGATTALDALRRGQNNLAHETLANLLEGGENR